MARAGARKHLVERCGKEGMNRISITVLAVLLPAGCGEASTGYDYEAEPRRTPLTKQCGDFASGREVAEAERAGKLTRADKQWLDADGDGRFCEERGMPPPRRVG